MSGRVFISHAGNDAVIARAVAAYLRGQGLSPLLDRDSIAAGDSFLSFMEDGLSTSDYFLLLWSADAASSRWVRIEWEAALHRAVSDARGFLVVGRLDQQPPPCLLAPRLFVELHPELLPGIDDLVRMWRQDLAAEEQSGKPVASNQSLSLATGEERRGVTVYVTSELFGVVVPVTLDLSLPAAAVVSMFREQLSLPTSLDHHGQIGVRFEYRLLHNELPLDIGKALEQQGVKSQSVLWLECTMRPFAATSPQLGVLSATTFRTGSTEAQALKSAHRQVSAVIRAADLDKIPDRTKGSPR